MNRVVVGSRARLDVQFRLQVQMQPGCGPVVLAFAATRPVVVESAGQVLVVVESAGQVLVRVGVIIRIGSG